MWCDGIDVVWWYSAYSVLAVVLFECISCICNGGVGGVGGVVSRCQCCGGIIVELVVFLLLLFNSLCLRRRGITLTTSGAWCNLIV